MTHEAWQLALRRCQRLLWRSTQMVRYRTDHRAGNIYSWDSDMTSRSDAVLCLANERTQE